jgi:hypothetical protein
MLTMLSMTERLAQARRFVIAAFELDDLASDVVVLQWTTDPDATLQVLLAIGNMVLVRVAVDPEGDARFNMQVNQ